MGGGIGAIDHFILHTTMYISHLKETYWEVTGASKEKKGSGEESEQEEYVFSFLSQVHRRTKPGSRLQLVLRFSM